MFLIRCIVCAAIGYCATFFAPWLVSTLGFGLTGVRPKTVAAWFQARYKGVIPKNGVFSILQKWGMAGVPGVLNVASFCLAGRVAWGII
ncbi:hypothetical protein HPB52_003083 [Rhipicephalus sanguineus]|uniref:Uncharacterized protein n=1 Tax=Rhipicephalus sanguineus TaxID=34632 RepID=A0A9D4PSB4_RHISA|nr:hypothetical protein HPB52_003083 [Rhipicephalus sanguineus]